MFAVPRRPRSVSRAIRWQRQRPVQCIKSARAARSPPPPEGIRALPAGGLRPAGRAGGVREIAGGFPARASSCATPQGLRATTPLRSRGGHCPGRPRRWNERAWIAVPMSRGSNLCCAAGASEVTTGSCSGHRTLIGRRRVFADKSWRPGLGGWVSVGGSRWVGPGRRVLVGGAWRVGVSVGFGGRRRAAPARWICGGFPQAARPGQAAIGQGLGGDQVAPGRAPTGPDPVSPAVRSPAEGSARWRRTTCRTTSG